MTTPADQPRRIEGPEDLAEVFDVSAATLERLATYQAVLARWQRAVNLVAPATIPDIWHRHFADSLQLARFIPQGEGRALADLGSGAGFPGLVLAAHFADRGGPEVILVESDQRKAAFLREAARAMEISVEILSTRI
jgi:16S rRNA (guanine527-N7)-methyltransferase